MSLSNSSISSSEWHDGVKLFRRGGLFALLFVMAIAFIVVIDPFEYWRLFPIVPKDVKVAVAPELNSCFWKMNELDRHPIANILLGDSRMLAVKPAVVRQITGEEYANLAYGGGTLREAIETFWVAAEKSPLRKVLIGVNLNTYNDYDSANRMQMHSSINRNPALYLVNRTVWEAAFYISYKWLTNDTARLGTPKVDRETFWKYELDIMRLSYSRYIVPRRYKQDLQKLAEYSRQNNIELTFVIFPTHIDEQRLIQEAHLEAQGRAMREDLIAWGQVMDFEFDNDLTEEKDNYSDPVHLREQPLNLVVREVFGHDLRYGRQLN